jgi:hypothetical protein
MQTGHHHSPAPGFNLATNQRGEWRGQYSSRGKTLLTPYVDSDTSRQSAIDRTWYQYEFENAEDANNWSAAE